MSEVKYSKEHEWIKIEGEIGTIGITQHATEMLGDIVFVELPDMWVHQSKKMEMQVLLNLLKQQVMCIHSYFG